MADFVLLSKALPSTDSQGVMTQGIGFPLRDVDPSAPVDFISAQDVTFSDPVYPNLTNVAQALLFLLAATRETAATFTSQNVTLGMPYLNIGNVSSEDTGWINTGTGFISNVTIGRVDVDGATLELLINGVVEEEFVTNSAASSFGPLFIQLNDLDTIAVRKKAGSPSMTSVVFTATVKQVSQ